jgi:molybdopterin molybdotransferase
VLAEPVTAPLDLPPWDNSGMDGYAVHAADVRGATDAQPTRLRLAGDLPAGQFAAAPLARGTAIRIMTGAPVPAGADSVIRVEHTRVDGEDVVIRSDADAARNIRPRGEDMRRGENVLRPGTLVGLGEAGVLASVGRTAVAVHRRPRVAVLATGDELVEVAQFAEVLAGRRIVNSNTHALHAGLIEVGAIPIPLGIAADRSDVLRAHLEGARAADALIVTAGASVGERDLVKDVLDAMGMTGGFWRVRMRPGSPFGFGVLRGNGERMLPVFSLPGNPVSAVVTFEVLVRPVLRRLLGRAHVYPRTMLVRAAEAIPSRRGLMHFLRVSVQQPASGTWYVRLTGAQGSGMLTSLTRADALLIVPETSEGLAAGERGLVLPLHGGEAAQAEPRFEITNEEDGWPSR